MENHTLVIMWVDRAHSVYTFNCYDDMIKFIRDNWENIAHCWER